MNKEHVTGKVNEVKGKVKESIGKATDAPPYSSRGTEGSAERQG
jgi:uncharacterized protein YjbJ (UPF0337 family)